MRGTLEFEQPLGQELYTRYPRAWPSGRVRARAKVSCIQGQERARDVRVSCIQSKIWNESSKICRFDIISTTKRPIKIRPL